MKKSFLLIGLISLISLVGCQKEQAVNTRLTATIENGAKTYFNISSATDNPGVVTWKADDEVWVNDYQFTATSLSNNGQTAVLESYAIPDAPYTAIYPYDAASTNEGEHYVTLPATQEYTGNEVHAPMYAYSEGNTLQFRNLCGMLVLNLQATGKTLQSITVTTGSEPLSGTFKINETGDEPELVVWDVLDGGNTVTLDCGTDGVSINEATNFYLYLPPGHYHTLEITFTATDGTVCTKAFQSGENAYAAFDVVRSQYNLLTFAGLTFIPAIPAGAINGLFTIADGVQVYFSKGNLQYIGSASTPYWKFADNQWDVLGTTTGQNSSATNVDRDLFGWGCSGWNSGANAYMPYSTSGNYNDYYPGGNWENDLTGETYAEADWAWHNAISNGGNAAHKWRTLTHAEWEYVFNYRDDAESKWGHGKVNNVNGMVILPDSWTLPDGLPFFTWGYSEWANEYDLDQWAQMEAAGAVFLPAAGFRWSTNVDEVYSYGHYWSSTHFDWSHAYFVYFISDDDPDTDAKDYRYVGLAVRPVQEYVAD